jgi:hypothetical protein
VVARRQLLVGRTLQRARDEVLRVEGEARIAQPHIVLNAPPPARQNLPVRSVCAVGGRLDLR